MLPRLDTPKTLVALTSCAPTSNPESERAAVSFFQEVAGPLNVLFPNQYMTVIRRAFVTPAMRLMLGLIAAVSLAACHGGQQQTIAEPVAAPTAKVQDEASRKIPADLYAGMPIYPGAEVQHVRKPKGAMREIVFELKNPPALDEMVNYYKDGLKKGDFKITSMLIMRARKTWSCDFHKAGRPGSVMLYPADDDKSATTIDLIYEVPSNMDQALLEPREEFDVVGPGQPGDLTPVAQNDSQDKAKQKEKAKRN